jgi:hypothetical protein
MAILRRPHQRPDRRPLRSTSFRRWVAILSVMVVVLIGARLALPTIAKNAINKRINEIPEYSGEVSSVGINLLRGAYRLNDVRIVKRSGQINEPFFKAESIDFSLAWRELFRGKVVSDISLAKPELSFVKGPSEETSQLEADKRWQEVIADLFPIDITHLEIHDGQLRFVNTETTPRVDVRVAHAKVVATGLRNRAEPGKERFPARIEVQGDTIGLGKLRMTAELEPLAEQPHFLLKAELEDVSLPALNEFLRAYANVDVRAGNFKGYLEMTARDGRFHGYFKPFFEEIDFSDLPEQAKKPITQQLWEGVVRFVAFIFKNHEKDQLATRIPFSGEFGDTEVNVWQTIVNTLRHAFVRPWPERLESKGEPRDENSIDREQP